MAGRDWCDGAAIQSWHYLPFLVATRPSPRVVPRSFSNPRRGSGLDHEYPSSGLSHSTIDSPSHLLPCLPQRDLVPHSASRPRNTHHRGALKKSVPATDAQSNNSARLLRLHIAYELP